MIRSLSVLLLLTLAAHALDTTEPFDMGFSDNEAYATVGGLGSGGDLVLESEYLIGIGITDRLSSSLAVGTSTDHYLANAEWAIGAGLFLNVVDSDLFKLDIAAGLSTTGDFALGTELNFDFERFGLQLTLEEAFANAANSETDVDLTTGIAPLLYVSLSENAQLLTAVDFSVAHNGDGLQIGSAALGYNQVISDAIELITEVSLDIPQDSEPLTGAVSIGFVATIP